MGFLLSRATKSFLFICLLSLLNHPALAEPPTVLVSIKPIHSLVTGVMRGVGEPDLLIPGGQSPHTFSLRPSDIQKLSAAKLIVWVGENFETPLSNVLRSIPQTSQVIGLMGHPAIKHLPMRKGGTWEPGHVGETTRDHGHRHDHDPHIWLSIENAKAVVEIVEAQLIAIDPEHRINYQSNAQKLTANLQKLDVDLRESLAKISHLPYMVFHDAYQFFEREYGLNAVGSIVVSPERQPGARRIHDVHEKLQRFEAHCIFTEPQFPPKLLAILTEDTQVKTGILDPLGADLPAGPDAYFQLLRNLADNLIGCLE